MLSIGRIAALTLIALSLFQLVDAYAVRRAPTGSNGERLARGLHPAPPKRFYDPLRHVARQDPSATPTSDTVTSSDTSTPTDPASTPSAPPSSTPSSTPPPSSDPPSSAPPSSTPSSAAPSQSSPAPAPNPTGFVTLQKISTPQKRDDAFGYVGAVGMASSIPSSSTPGPRDAWSYTFVRPDPLGSVVELSSTNSPAYKLGGTTYSTTTTLGPGRQGYLQLSNVRGHTAAGAPAAWMQGFIGTTVAQTTIFSVDPNTNEITVKWVNPDGSIPKTYVVEYSNPQYSYGIFATGDLSTLAATLGTSVSNLNVVRLFYTEIVPPSA